jgi:hypothetical protein
MFRGDQQRDKQEQAAELGAKVPLLETEGAASTRAFAGRSSSAQRGNLAKPVGGEEFPDRWRAQALVAFLQGALDIVDRAVLLAQGKHPRMRRGGLLGSGGRCAQRMPVRQEEW